MTTQPNSDILPQETRIGRTALRVSDLEEMTEFYRDIVGLSVLKKSNTSSTLGVENEPLLILEADETAPKRHRSAAGLFHNAFRVPSRSALGDALSRIRSQWHLSGASDHGVSEALYSTDPEGNGIEIYRDLPREEWPFTIDGSVRMGTSHLNLTPIEAVAAGNSEVPAGTDVGHIHLEVSSLEAFRAFYVDVLGFEVQMELPAAVFISAGGYHHHIGANTWNHRSGAVGGRGLLWFEVIVPETSALNVIRGRITDSQYMITEVDDGISVTGPDEIEIRFHIES